MVNKQSTVQQFHRFGTEVNPSIQMGLPLAGIVGLLDNNGDLDLLVVNLNEPPSLLRNDTAGNHRWLKVLLIGRTSAVQSAGVNASCGGKKQAQAVAAQSSLLSMNDRTLHFGLGHAAPAA